MIAGRIRTFRPGSSGGNMENAARVNDNKDLTYASLRIRWRMRTTTQAAQAGSD